MHIINCQGIMMGFDWNTVANLKTRLIRIKRVVKLTWIFVWFVYRIFANNAKIYWNKWQQPVIVFRAVNIGSIVSCDTQEKMCVYKHFSKVSRNVWSNICLPVYSEKYSLIKTFVKKIVRTLRSLLFCCVINARA